ncbi:MAG: prepilin-type N-terminal cleavage/methylation domain-containing protein [Opitutaceae bacterium]|nr:prepilin-type N-terminal cleavage/methylation domain-containing protein [Opitutaceae bacterium]
MTITTRWPGRDRRRRGYTLVEVLIASTLAAFTLLGVLSSFLFLVRSGTNIRNYSDMESQARKALELFAEDVRQASAITWPSNQSVTLTVNSQPITYTFNSGNNNFTRTHLEGVTPVTRVLISGVTPNTFTFRAYTVSGTELPLASPANLTAAGVNTKQLQISLQATRSNQTVVSATNTVLSARFILRNKIVTA